MARDAVLSSDRSGAAGQLGRPVAPGPRGTRASAVAAEKPDVCPPCGGCRQRLKEFARPGTPVYLGRPGGPVHVTTVGELLPLAFDEESLA